MLYRFLNSNNEILYIGKTCSHNPQLRFNCHFTQGHLPTECYDETYKIEIAELNTESDVSVYEPYLINLHKPKYNIEFKHKDNLTITLPELIWFDKTLYLENIKEQETRIKNNIEFLKRKAENRLNKGEAYTKFKLWLDNQNNGRIIKTKDIIIESGLDSKHLEKLKSRNGFVCEWFKQSCLSRGVYKIT